ncbi:hypothetical protein [Bacterioplanoides pacificum]|uniref:Lipoprotein n=1 Tax=Bacterioplanoides pacificum TaxID=1171596 RepID=A0ABV7VRX7_9GAMM
MSFKNLSKIIFIKAILLVTYGCSSINVNPNSKAVDCSLYKGNQIIKDSKHTSRLKTKDGRVFDVISFGRLENQTPLSIHYGRGCYLDLLNDVSHIERVDDKQQKVTLRNGSEILIGTYELDEKLKSPYSHQAWPLIIADEGNKGIKYAPKVIHPFKELERLDIRNKPLADDIHKVFVTQRDNEVDAIRKANEEYKRQVEAFRLAKIEQRKKEREQERIKQQELKKRNREIISNRSNIGIQICRNGMLTYKDTGYRNRQEPGQLIGFLEDVSPDKLRLKFSVHSHATPKGHLKYYASTIPQLGNFTAERGAVYWDKIQNWHPCGN